MRYIVFFIFALLQPNIYAFSNQINSFEISGEINGQAEFKYVYLFGENYSFIEKKEISNHKFNFSGNCPAEFESGAISNGMIYLSNSEVVPEPRDILNNKAFRRKIIFEPHISIVFYSDRNYFDVKGGGFNEINNSFADAEYQVFHQSDSLRSHIWAQDITDQKKKELQYINIQNANKKQDVLFVNLIEKHKNSPVSLLYFFNVILFLNVPREKTQATYNLLSNEIRTSKYGIRIGKLFDELDEFQKIKTKTKLNVGDQFPTFQLPDVNGKPVLSNTKYGKYTLIDFWAIWCIPCMREIPNLKKTLNTHYNKGFRVIAISMDAIEDKHKWIQAIKTNNLSQFTNLINPTGMPGIAKDLEIVAIPVNYLIDQSGKVIATNIHGDELSKKLNELIGN